MTSEFIVVNFIDPTITWMAVKPNENENKMHYKNRERNNKYEDCSGMNVHSYTSADDGFFGRPRFDSYSGSSS